MSRGDWIYGVVKKCTTLGSRRTNVREKHCSTSVMLWWWCDMHRYYAVLLPTWLFVCLFYCLFFFSLGGWVNY